MIGILEILTFCILLISYGAIWVKVRQASKVVDAKIGRCNRTAKIMMIFVVVFLFQWWIQILFVVWGLFGTVLKYLAVVSECLINLGGVYDCVAYTVIRRRFQTVVSPAPK